MLKSQTVQNAVLSGGVRGEEWQHGLVKIARHDLGKAVAAMRKELYFRTRNESRELFGEIGGGDDVVLSGNDQRRRADMAQLLAAIEGEDGVDAAHHDFRRREGGECLRFPLAKPLIVLCDPCRRV